jgi:hypothetical protein
MLSEDKKTDSKLTEFLQELKINIEKSKKAMDVLPKLTSDSNQACEDWNYICSSTNSDHNVLYHFRPINDFRDSFYALATKNHADCSGIVVDIAKGIMCEIAKNKKFVPKDFKGDHLSVLNKEGTHVKKIDMNVGTIGSQKSCTIVLEKRDGSESGVHTLFFCMVDKTTSDTILFLIDAWSAGGTMMVDTDRKVIMGSENNERRLMMINLTKSSPKIVFGYSKSEELTFLLTKNEEIVE